MITTAYATKKAPRLVARRNMLVLTPMKKKAAAFATKDMMVQNSLVTSPSFLLSMFVMTAFP